MRRYPGSGSVIRAAALESQLHGSLLHEGTWLMVYIDFQVMWDSNHHILVSFLL